MVFFTNFEVLPARDRAKGVADFITYFLQIDGEFDSYKDFETLKKAIPALKASVQQKIDALTSSIIHECSESSQPRIEQICRAYIFNAVVFADCLSHEERIIVAQELEYTPVFEKGEDFALTGVFIIFVAFLA